MGLQREDSSVAATPANVSPVPPAQLAATKEVVLPAREVLIIRQNAMSNAMGSPIVAALAVTVTTEQEQMNLVRRWAEMSEQFVTRAENAPAVDVLF